MEVEEAKVRSLNQHDLGIHRAGGWLGSKRLGSVQDKWGGLREKRDRSRVSEALRPTEFYRCHLHGFLGAGTEEMDNWFDSRNATGKMGTVKGQGTKGLPSHRMWIDQRSRDSGFPGDPFQWE